MFLLMPSTVLWIFPRILSLGCFLWDRLYGGLVKSCGLRSGCFFLPQRTQVFSPVLLMGKPTSYINVVKDPVYVHDLQGILLHLFGIDHKRPVYKHQSRRFRLTDVKGEVVSDIVG